MCDKMCFVGLSPTLHLRVLLQKVVGPQLAVNFHRAHEWVEGATKSVAVKTYMDNLLRTPVGIFWRILVAMDQNKM